MSALQALAAEVGELNVQISLQLGMEEDRRVESIAARQALDAASSQRAALEARRDATRQALTLIQKRDDVSDETVITLITAAER